MVAVTVGASSDGTSSPRCRETRNPERMQFLTLEDEHGLVEAVLLPGACARLGGRITTPGPFLVGGRVVEREGALHLRLSELKPFYERHPNPALPASSVR